MDCRKRLGTPHANKKGGKCEWGGGGFSGLETRAERGAHWPWLTRTRLQAALIFGRLACRQASTRIVSCRSDPQNLCTSGPQAARSSGVPCGIGNGGNGSGGRGDWASSKQGDFPEHPGPFP
jgi:hypothetical protein